MLEELSLCVSCYSCKNYSDDDCGDEYDHDWMYECNHECDDKFNDECDHEREDESLLWWYL